jgi:hypothetical protein
MQSHGYTRSEGWAPMGISGITVFEAPCDNLKSGSFVRYLGVQ